MARRQGERRSRSEISGKVENHQAEMSEKGEQIDKSVGDIEVERQTREQMDLSGTAEAAESIEQALEAAENVSVEAYEAESQELEQVLSEAETHEAELRERSDAASADLDKLSDANSRLHGDSATRELAKATEESRRDIEFLKEHEARAREAREESRRLHEERQQRVSVGRRS